MVSAFDNNVLCLLLHPDADVPDDPETGRPVVRAKDRISYLVEQLRERGSRILIPTPVLMEFMTYASPEYLNEINASAHFEISPFDQRAAIEAGRAIQKAKDSPNGKKLGLEGKWQKIKLDWQIAAIVKVNGSDVLYSTDTDLGTIAAAFNIKVIHVSGLPLPPSDAPLLEALDATDDESDTHNTKD